MASEHQPVSEKPILVVDDDHDQRAACRQVLEAHGHQVEEAANGREALRRLIDNGSLEPCLILLDLSMPVMDGWELLAVLKGDERLSHIPVVLISASEPNLDAARHGAIAAHLRKPFEPAALLDLVKRFCARSASEGRRG